ncbi:MAG: sigma-70 family RNA polymerase sigma factor [Oscillospiraceae bacterium]|nr:sigma-70 family RNA polymerase sigma factor [Oscillospiraceae bacterium]
MDEARLIARAAGGDQGAFETLVKNYEKQVYSLALRMSRNRDDAYDLSQEVFLRVYRALPSFMGDSSFSTWLYRLSHNICLDHLRKTKRRRELPLTLPSEDGGEERERDLPDTRYDPERQWEKKELQEAIAHAMGSLRPDQRAVLTLREIQGLSYDEIADVLALPAGTVKSRLARAREALREILISQGTYSPSETSKSSSSKERGGGAP